MSIIMDRVQDLNAVDWESLPLETIHFWEQEAECHDAACRCQKCALFFARLTPETFQQVTSCAISSEVIAALRQRLNK